MTKNQIKIHDEFRLNGNSYPTTDLKALAYDLIKEGQPFEKEIGAFLTEWLDSQPIIEVRTSGSTGTPKKIVLQKHHMVNSALATGKFFNLQAKQNALLCLPVEFIAGKMMLVRAMVLGLHVDYVAPTSNPLTNSKSYDFVAMVPLQVTNSIENIDAVKALLIGGAAVSVPLKTALKDKRVAAFESYGMTETITHIAVKSINDAAQTQTSDSDSNCFTALPNVLLSIDDRNCLIINAPEICDAQVNTNDIVNLKSGTTFEWLGRYDNVINSGGIKLFPEQIEQKLAPFIAQAFFVAGIVDGILGQKLILVVEGAADADSILSKITEIKSLERFEIPKNVYLLPKFVTSGNGKIRRIETLKLLHH